MFPFVDGLSSYLFAINPRPLARLDGPRPMYVNIYARFTMRGIYAPYSSALCCHAIIGLLSILVIQLWPLADVEALEKIVLHAGASNL